MPVTRKELRAELEAANAECKRLNEVKNAVQEKLVLVSKQNADNLKMRGEYMKERDVALLEVRDLAGIITAHKATIKDLEEEAVRANTRAVEHRKLLEEIASRAEAVPGGEELYNFTKWLNELTLRAPQASGCAYCSGTKKINVATAQPGAFVEVPCPRCTSPTERTCCVEAYARGFEIGKARGEGR